MKKETHKQAHDRLFNYLKAKGWQTSSPLLKYRWAEMPGTASRTLPGYRVWFKSQALYTSSGISSLNDARSFIQDIRSLDSEVLLAMFETDEKRGLLYT